MLYSSLVLEDKTKLVTFRATPENVEGYERAAARSGLPLSQWIRLVLNSASGQSELQNDLVRAVVAESTKIREGDWLKQCLKLKSVVAD